MRVLVSALVAVAAIAVAPASATADDNAVATSSFLDERAAAAQATSISSAITGPTAEVAPATTAAKKFVPNFTARGLAAIRATRSASLFRWGTPSYAKWYAKSHIAKKYEWGSKQFGCLVSLWNRESHWSYRSANSGGRTFGIPQTNRRTILAFGTSFGTYMATPEVQVQVGAKYINYRYGSPCKAYAHAKRHGWY